MRPLVQPSLSFQFLASVSFIDFETGGIRMLKIVGRVLTVSALIAGASAVAWAQHGGKAEPLRIEFKTGTKTTTITEKISGSGMITVVRPTSSPGSSTYKMVVTVK